jgi:hypothetical protein
MSTNSTLYSVVRDPDGVPHRAVAATSLGAVALAITVLVTLAGSITTAAIVVAATVPLWVIAIGGRARRHP